VHALVISEIMSNPVGDDGGREWIEVYNDSDGSVDLSTLTISIKGGSFIAVTPVSGGVMLAPHSYAIIGSTVSGATKFTQDYAAYTGPLFKSALSLVNTGVTSLELKLQGQTVDTLASYTAAKEGQTWSRFVSGFASGEPTPGQENKAVSISQDTATTTEGGTQTTLPQMSAPSADIVLYLPTEKIVVAGAPALFTVSALTRAGRGIEGMTYAWSFGDGGSRTGSSTLYRYFYPGRYVAQVEGTNGFVAGTGRMTVRVVSPDISMSPIGFGKYGSYIDITNPNAYDLDISDWKLVIDSVPFSFPRNTLLPVGVTRFSGAAMGFSNVTVSSTTLIKLLFPSMDELLRFTQGEGVTKDNSPLLQATSSKIAQVTLVSSKPLPKITYPIKIQSKASSTKPVESTASSSQKVVITTKQKDTRMATFFKNIFSK
jgi:hypothetical protein